MLSMKRFNLEQQILFENLGVGCRFIGAVGKNIPAAEDEIIEISERNKVLNHGRTSIRTLAETNGPHLCQRTDRGRNSFTYGLHASHECGSDRP